MAIKNAPAVTNTGGFETRTTESKHLACKTDGQNTGGFENRAAQESGSH